jgi:hypothetical protein
MITCGTYIHQFSKTTSNLKGCHKNFILFYYFKMILSLLILKIYQK